MNILNNSTPRSLFSCGVTNCYGDKDKGIQHAEGRHASPDWRGKDAESSCLPRDTDLHFLSPLHIATPLKNKAPRGSQRPSAKQRILPVFRGRRSKNPCRFWKRLGRLAGGTQAARDSGEALASGTMARPTHQ